jgi:hypothetical protein
MPSVQSRGFLGTTLTGLAPLTPVDIASLIVFRTSFGLIVAWWAFDYLRTGRAHILYAVPKFHFTYYGFDWVQPLPGGWLNVHFGAMLLCGLLIAAGLAYRFASATFAFLFTWFFLLDRTNYQNHYYLITLISWMMIFLPLHRHFALDAIEANDRGNTVPAWMLWLVRFHIGVPYFFGGIAKLEPEWLAGGNMRGILLSQGDVPVVGPWLAHPAATPLFVWGGLLLDLLVVPALLWKPTRIPAFLAALAFHLTNAVLFDIHIFPWFMILATTVFFEPDWPRKLLRRPSIAPEASAPVHWSQVPLKTQAVASLLAAYCLFHCLWPLRHLMNSECTSWTERGHTFSWRMMLRAKATAIRYFITDEATGRTQAIDLAGVVNENQLIRFPRDPEMVLHMAHFLAGETRKATKRPVQVHALVFASLNGRKPQLLIDPNVDLASEPRGIHRRDWIMPLTEPRQDPPWMVPPGEWGKYVQAPELKFLSRRKTAVSNDAATLAAPVHADEKLPSETRPR